MTADHQALSWLTPLATDTTHWVSALADAWGRAGTPGRRGGLLSQRIHHSTATSQGLRAGTVPPPSGQAAQPRLDGGPGSAPRQGGQGGVQPGPLTGR